MQVIKFIIATFFVFFTQAASIATKSSNQLEIRDATPVSQSIIDELQSEIPIIVATVLNVLNQTETDITTLVDNLLAGLGLGSNLDASQIIAATKQDIQSQATSSSPISSDLLPYVIQLVEGIVKSLDITVGDLLGSLPTLVGSLVKALGLTLNNVVDLVVGLLKSLGVTLTDLLGSLPGIVAGLVNTLGLTLNQVITLVVGLVKGLGIPLGDVLGLVGSIVNLLGSTLGDVTALLNGILGAL
ncbi:unnamed protein product [Candida verbasci]|uniref:Uncharacterized protein n=1 Tax=Candida verbasci TaxID=1227364 RepID=A0A9W4TXH1_9ASCO|nr:unnamed protein product [Candida verbasci]